LLAEREPEKKMLNEKERLYLNFGEAIGTLTKIAEVRGPHREGAGKVGAAVL